MSRMLQTEIVTKIDSIYCSYYFSWFNFPSVYLCALRLPSTD